MNPNLDTDHKVALDSETEYLLFNLGSEEYAVCILKVQEIRGYDPVTRIVNTPQFIKGVINLRGEIIPIVDLRIRFNFNEVTYTPFTVVIILSILEKTIGIVVDGVSDVISFKKSEIRPVSDIGLSVDHGFMMGLVALQERLVVLLDIEKILKPEELSLLKNVPESL